MKLLRKLHLYLGVFFAPMLIFFVGTGWYQTVHEDRLKSPADAETLVQKLRVVHTDQIYPGGGDVRRQSPKLFKTLVVVMCTALLATTALGLVLAWRMMRPKWALLACLALGAAVPVLILWLGQKRE